MRAGKISLCKFVNTRKRKINPLPHKLVCLLTTSSSLQRNIAIYRAHIAKLYKRAYSSGICESLAVNLCFVTHTRTLFLRVYFRLF